MDFRLRPLPTEHIAEFKRDMQQAFRQGAAEELGESDDEILPESDIDRSLSAKGSAAFEAVVDGEMAGGAIVVINEETQHNHLDFLYVKVGAHNKGVGLAIWQAIEALFPDTVVWETVTPYFERRNIHFYVNKCGFRIVEFFNDRHPEPHDPTEQPQEEGCPDFFRFEKQMKPRRD